MTGTTRSSGGLDDRRKRLLFRCWHRGTREMDLILGGTTGRMVAIQDGKYTHTSLPDPAFGPRRVDVPVMYNAERFRPRYEGKLGDPMLLVGLD